MIKRIIIEFFILIMAAAVAAAALLAYLHFTGFSDIQCAAYDDSGRLAVLDKTKQSYKLYIFDSEGRMIRCHTEEINLDEGWPDIWYGGIASAGDCFYLHKRIYTDGNLRSRDSIVAFATDEIVEVYHADLIHDVMSAADKKIYFIAKDNAALDGEDPIFGSADKDDAVLVSYDEINGARTESVRVPDSGGRPMIYAGDGVFFLTDLNSHIIAHDAKTGETAKPLWKGSVHTASFNDGKLCFFDARTGDIILYGNREVIFRQPLSKAPAGRPDLRDGRITVVERDQDLKGVRIHTWDTDDSGFTHNIFRPNFISKEAIRIHLPLFRILLISYALLRLFLFLLMECKLSLMPRIALILVPFAAGGILAAFSIYSRLFFNQQASFEKQKFEVLEQNLNLEEIREAILNVSLATDAESEEYLNLISALSTHPFIGNNGESLDGYSYFDIYLKSEENFFSMYSPTYPKGGSMRYLFSDKDFSRLLECVEENKRYTYKATLSQPFYYDQIAIYDDSNRLRAVIEIGLDLTTDVYLAQALARRQVFPLIFAVSCVLIVFLVVTRFTTYSLSTIKAGVERIRNGERGVRIEVKSDDELGAIALAFNQMSQYVDDKLNESETYYRFVPNEIFELFGKTVDTIRLGDSTRLPITLMRLGIPDFYRIKSGMSDEKRLASCFGKIADIVNCENGYLKDIDPAGTLCFFRGSVKRALTAALKICEALPEYGVDVAVDFGDATITVMGEASRLQITVVSKMAETLHALRGYSNSLNSRIVLTESAFAQLEDSASFRYRYLGGVNVQGKTLRIYDFFDADCREDYMKKAETLHNFSVGVEFFDKGDMLKAHDAFIKVLKVFPGDNASRRYLGLCEEGENK